MTIRRLLLATGLVLTLGAWLLMRPTDRALPIPAPAIQAIVLDPYDTPLLQGYKRYRDALLGDDLEVVAEIADGSGSYLAYRASLTLARHPERSPLERLPHYRRVLELQLDDPLAWRDRQALELEYARTAEAAGAADEARAAYLKALPADEAAQALERLVDNPYRLANAFFGARLYGRAIEALGERGAPSIEAPSYRRLGEHAKALDAYQRWLEEQPDNAEARSGLAWEHFYLGELDLADALFAAIGDSDALYGRALIANRRGDVDRAVALLERHGGPYQLWLASGLLEARDRYREVVPIYLELAASDSSYADDAAYRALVLANRFGDEAAAAEARARIPAGSFFALKLGESPRLPTLSTLPPAQPEVLELARALARANDLEAAVGELGFALREAGDEATVVAIGETLQAYGEYRQSQRAAQAYLERGSRQLRTWRLAYPRAYPELVEAAAAREAIDPALVWAVMRQESAFYPQAVSRSNAQGLMQVIPSTWQWLAELQKEEPGDTFDPADNIRYGSYYLKWLLDYLGGDIELVIPSYNRGQGYIKRLFEGSVVAGDKDEFYREIDAAETREYLQRVMVNYRTYRALYGELATSDELPTTSGGDDRAQ